MKKHILDLLLYYLVLPVTILTCSGLLFFTFVSVIMDTISLSAPSAYHNIVRRECSYG